MGMIHAVNNVGTNVRSLTEDYKDEDYHTVIATNLDSAFLLTKVRVLVEHNLTSIDTSGLPTWNLKILDWRCT